MQRSFSQALRAWASFMLLLCSITEARSAPSEINAPASPRKPTPRLNFFDPNDSTHVMVTPALASPTGKPGYRDEYVIYLTLKAPLLCDALDKVRETFREKPTTPHIPLLRLKTTKAEELRQTVAQAAQSMYPLSDVIFEKDLMFQGDEAFLKVDPSHASYAALQKFQETASNMIDPLTTGRLYQVTSQGTKVDLVLVSEYGRDFLVPGSYSPSVVVSYGLSLKSEVSKQKAKSLLSFSQLQVSTPCLAFARADSLGNIMESVEKFALTADPAQASPPSSCA